MRYNVYWYIYNEHQSLEHTNSKDFVKSNTQISYSDQDHFSCLLLALQIIAKDDKDQDDIFGVFFLFVG